MLGEDDELAAAAVHVEHLRVFEHVAQLVPLPVDLRRAHGLGHAGELPEARNLLLELDNGGRGARQVDDLLRLGLGLFFEVVLKVFHRP